MHNKFNLFYHADKGRKGLQDTNHTAPTVQGSERVMDNLSLFMGNYTQDNFLVCETDKKCENSQTFFFGWHMDLVMFQFQLCWIIIWAVNNKVKSYSISTSKNWDITRVGSTIYQSGPTMDISHIYGLYTPGGCMKTGRHN